MPCLILHVVFIILIAAFFCFVLVLLLDGLLENSARQGIASPKLDQAEGRVWAGRKTARSQSWEGSFPPPRLFRN